MCLADGLLNATFFRKKVEINEKKNQKGDIRWEKAKKLQMIMN